MDLGTWRTVQDQIPGAGGDLTVVDTAYVPYQAPIFYRAAVY
jgi:hypothetical protein